MIWLGILLAVTLAVYLALLAYDAKHDVDEAPRTDMLVCEKHGPFPVASAFHLTVGDGTPVNYCPFCFSDKMKKNK